MKRVIITILLSLAALSGLAYLVFASGKSKIYDSEKLCKDIVVSVKDYDKIQLVSDEEIAKLLANSNLHPIGKPMRDIKVKEIEDELGKHPMIRNIECYKTPGAAIKLNIEQRNPVLRIMERENYYIDDMRQVVPVASNFALYIPVATGKVSKELAAGELYDFVMFLNKNSFWDDQIEQIYINERGEVQLIPRVGDHLIVLGEFDRFEQKLEKLRKFYLYGLNEAGWNAYSKIDLQYRDQVVCTRK